MIVWDTTGGQRRAVYTGHAAGVNALAFSPDGKTLWSGGDDRAVFVWDLQRADTLVHRPSPTVAHAPALPFVASDMSFGPGGRYVVLPSADDHHFEILDVATGTLEQAVCHRGRVLPIVLAGQQTVFDRR